MSRANKSQKARGGNPTGQGLNVLPSELRKKLCKFTMTAEEGKSVFTDDVGPFKPDVVNWVK